MKYEQELFNEVSIDTFSKERLEQHIEEYIGPIESVYNYIFSYFVHIDIYHIAPTKIYPYHIFITSGMSDIPMITPKRYSHLAYAELIMYLPKEWSVKDGNIEHWPLNNLSYIPKYIHENRMFLSNGKTILCDSETEEMKMSGNLIMSPYNLSQTFSYLPIRENKMIHFYNIIPLHKEELEYKNKKGLRKLFSKFEGNEISPIVDIDRGNKCKPFWTLTK